MLIQIVWHQEDGNNKTVNLTDFYSNNIPNKTIYLFFEILHS